MNLLAPVLARVLEGELRDARGGLLGDHLQALDHAGHDLVLQAEVQALGIFAHDDQVDVGIVRGNVRKIPDGAEVGEEFESLAQFDVDARKAAANRRCDRTFQPDASALNRFGQLFRNVLFVFFEGFAAGREALPFEFDAGGFENADGGLDYFGANAVARDESYFMRHKIRSGHGVIGSSGHLKIRTIEYDAALRWPDGPITR